MNPNSVLANNPYQSPKFYYPLNLGSDSQSPYCIMDIRDSVAKRGGSKGTIATYMPPEVVAQYHANYEDASMGLMGADFTVQDAANAIYKTPAIKSVPKGIENLINSIGATALDASARAQRDLGMIVNPHMAPLFKGMGFRTFTLSWQMMARNAQESQMIQNIIFTMKYHMVPSVPEGDAYSRFMLYPEHFVILFATPKINQMFLIHECVLEDLVITYNGSGVPAFFEDTGAPVEHRIVAQFKELTIMTKERIMEGYVWILAFIFAFDKIASMIS